MLYIAIVEHPDEVAHPIDVAAAKTLRVREPTSGTSNVAVGQIGLYIADGLLDKGVRAG